MYNQVFNRRPVVVASHPRSGTHLLIDVLRGHFAPCRSWKWPGERLDRLYCNIDELGAEDEGNGLLDPATARRILRRTERPVVKTHAWPGYRDVFLPSQPEGLNAEWIDWLKAKATVFYIYRDGRDVLSSYQLFRQKYDPKAHCSIGTFLRQEIDGANRVQRWKRHVQQWLSTPGVHPVQFEALIATPRKVIEEMGHVLKCAPELTEPLLPRPFASIWHSRKARLFSMRPASSAIINEGSQKWKTCFTREDRLFFHQEAGDVLRALGYESSESWTLPE